MYICVVDAPLEHAPDRVQTEDHSLVGQFHPPYALAYSTESRLILQLSDVHEAASDGGVASVARSYPPMISLIPSITWAISSGEARPRVSPMRSADSVLI